MSIAEAILDKAKALPRERQIQVLDYVNFLLAQQRADAESADWAALSGAQLAKQYSAGDAVYDQE